MKTHLIPIVALMAWTGVSQENDWEQRGLDFEAKIRALLAEARASDNYRVVEQNIKMFRQARFSLPSEEYLDKDFPLYAKKYPERMLVLKLDTLQFFYDMMDKGYDVKNPLYRKISGFRKFSSKEEEDAWNRFLEENDRLHKKHVREWALFDEYESDLRSVQRQLINAETQKIKKPVGLEQLTQTINTHVADEKLREIIFSMHLVKSSTLDPSANPPTPPQPLKFEGRIKIEGDSMVDVVRKYAASFPSADERKRFLDDFTKRNKFSEEDVKLLYAPYEEGK